MKNRPTQNSETEAASDIPIDKVPDILQAYADGIYDYLNEHLLATMSRMVNHDLSGTFCIQIIIKAISPLLASLRAAANIAEEEDLKQHRRNEYDRMIIVEIGCKGVTVADFEYYRGVASATDNGIEPAPPPYLLDYNDPNLLEQLIEAIKCHGHQLHG